jgi:hypothetical protein
MLHGSIRSSCRREGTKNFLDEVPPEMRERISNHRRAKTLTASGFCLWQSQDPGVMDRALSGRTSG